MRVFVSAGACHPAGVAAEKLRAAGRTVIGPACGDEGAVVNADPIAEDTRHIVAGRRDRRSASAAVVRS